MASRDWGYWTEHKLEILADYLHAFTTASKTAGATVYLDLFAGSAENISRTTGKTIEGSPRIALRNDPPFTKVMLFELPSHAAKLDADLRAAFPSRDFTIVPGNCNDTLPDALTTLAPLNYAATFALLDQYAAEIRWTALEQLAAFKKARRYKVELWLLFAHAMLPRGLSQQTFGSFSQRVDAMYGTNAWRPIYGARQDNRLGAAELRRELLNLMRWRLEHELGYVRTHVFEMKNVRGQPIYSMIFATDNAAGDKIMSDVYAKAARQRPAMQAEAAARAQAKRDDEAGTPGLFDPLPRVVKPERLYVHEPPTPPWGWSEPGG